MCSGFVMCVGIVLNDFLVFSMAHQSVCPWLCQLLSCLNNIGRIRSSGCVCVCVVCLVGLSIQRVNACLVYMSVSLWVSACVSVSVLCGQAVQQPRPPAQHSIAQHSTAQHSTAQHSTAQHSIAQAQAPLFRHLVRLWWVIRQLIIETGNYSCAKLTGKWKVRQKASVSSNTAWSERTREE